MVTKLTVSGRVFSVLEMLAVPLNRMLSLALEKDNAAIFKNRQSEVGDRP